MTYQSPRVTPNSWVHGLISMGHKKKAIGMNMKVSFTGRKCDGMLGRWTAGLVCVYCVHFQNCIMTNLLIKRNLDFLKDYVHNWRGTGLMSKYYSILGNFYIHKEVSEASAKYCIGKEQRDEENDLEEQECSPGHRRCITSACCSESPLSP